MTSNVKVMYSDKIATIESDGEIVTLRDDDDVAAKVKSHLQERINKETKIDEVSILLYSYVNPPQLPYKIPCMKWMIKCESHTPYVSDVLKAVPVGADELYIEVDNGGLGRQAYMEQVTTARNLTLKTTDFSKSQGTYHVSNEQLLKLTAGKLYVNSPSIDETGINQLLHKVSSSDGAQFSFHIGFYSLCENRIENIFQNLDYEKVDGVFVVNGTWKNVHVKLDDQFVTIVSKSK